MFFNSLRNRFILTSFLSSMFVDPEGDQGILVAVILKVVAEGGGGGCRTALKLEYMCFSFAEEGGETMSRMMKVK